MPERSIASATASDAGPAGHRDRRVRVMPRRRSVGFAATGVLAATAGRRRAQRSPRAGARRETGAARTAKRAASRPAAARVGRGHGSGCVRTALRVALRRLPRRERSQRHPGHALARRPARLLCDHAALPVSRGAAQQRGDDRGRQDDEGRRPARLRRRHRYLAGGAAAAARDAARSGADEQGPRAGAPAQVRVLPRRRPERRPAGAAHRRAARGVHARDPARLQVGPATRLHAGDDRGGEPGVGRRARHPGLLRRARSGGRRSRAAASAPRAAPAAKR